jgi:hypothetical protein
VSAEASVVAGGAFLTALGTPIPWGLLLNRKVTVSDGTNTAIGYVGAVGTGETYDSSVVVNGGFASDTANWTALDSTLASVAGGQSGNCLEITRVAGTNQGAYQNFTGALTAGALYRVRVYVKSGTSGNEGFFLSNMTGMTTLYGTSTASWAPATTYYNGSAVAGNWIIAKQSSTAGTMLFDEASIQRVLTPGPSGCIIVSAPGGATQSWESDSGLNLNAANFSITIER